MRRAVDTNVLVRLITQDEPEQLEKATDLLSNGSVVVLTTVFLETEWVLRSAFGYSRDRVAGSLEAFVSLPNVMLTEEERVTTALILHRHGMDFADALHLSGADECDEFVSFDEALVKRANRSALTSLVPVRLA